MSVKRFGWVAVLWALMAAIAPPVASAARSASALSRQPLPASSAWTRHVIDPGAVVYPRAVQVVGSPSEVVNPNGLRAPKGGVTVIRATGAGSPRLVLDLGVNTGGYVEVGITKTDGTHVRLGYSELRAFLTPQGDNCGCSPITHLSLGVNDDPEGRTDVITAASPSRWRSPGIRGAERFISLELEGAGSVSIDYVRVRTEHLPAPPASYAGRFLSSDQLLNRVWYASTYTFALDSFKDLRPGHQSSHFVVVDGAKRDRLIWLGDLVVENLLGDYSLRAAPRIIRDSLAAFSCLQFSDGQLAPATQVAVTCPRIPPPAGGPFPPSATEGLSGAAAAIRLPEYTAWWIAAVHDYYLYTGDTDFARRMLPVMRRGLAYFQAHMQGGLFVTSGGLTINWHPNDPAAGVDAHTNATLFRALRDAAELERWLGRGRAAASLYDRRARALRRAMVTRLWDTKVGAFVINASDPRRNHTQDAQVEAVLDGVTDQAQSIRALRFVSTRLTRRLGTANGQYNDDPYMSNYISPYISSTELLARLRYGQAAAALGLIRREWGHMLTAGPGTLWEKLAFDGLPASYSALQAPADPFSQSGAGFTSLAHGWSGGPVPALSGYVLGIRPMSPGFRTWIVAPQTGNLRWAQGAAPTPHGPISSRWRRGRGDSSFQFTVSAPAHTDGIVEVPLLGHARVIAMDGRVVWDGRRGRGAVRASADRRLDAVAFTGVRGAAHTFAWVG